MSRSTSSKSEPVTPKVSVFQLSSGTTILAQVVHDNKDEYLVLNPLELRIGVTADGIASFQFLKWMPFNKTGIVLIHKNNIEGTTLTSPEFSKYYHFQVRKYAMIQERINERMNEYHTDESDEPMQEPFEDDGMDEDNISKTIH